MPATLFFIAGIAGMCAMGYLGTHMDKSARSNWIEEGVNAASQLAILIGAVIVYLGVFYHGGEAAKAALASTDTVAVTESEQGYMFDGPGTTDMLVFYQGAKVEPAAYAPLMSSLASQGIDCYLYLELCNDGTLIMTIVPSDMEAFKADMTEYLVQALYAELAASGLGKEAADAAFQEAYGMSIEEYAAYAVEETGLVDIFEDMRSEMVYYIEDNKIYMGDDWNDISLPSPIQLEGESMIIEEDMSSIGIYEDNMTFTRVVEE
jgi:hypothetical protein